MITYGELILTRAWNPGRAGNLGVKEESIQTSAYNISPEYNYDSDPAKLVGYEVVGHAYPMGDCDNRVARLIENNTGVKYARTTISTHNYEPQKDLYLFDPTVYHHREMDEMFRLGEEFLSLKTDEPKLFYIWGHAYEFDIHNDWKRFEEFLEMISGREDIFYGTNKECLER